MAIILDKSNEVKTHHFDFKDALSHCEDGIRCCLDIDLIFHEYSTTMIDDFKLIPLDDFKCKRTIVGTGGLNVEIESKFGLTKDDFIETGFQEVEVKKERFASMKGLLISRSNPYFEIINALAIDFEFVGANNDNSFVLDECELSEIKLVPFNLKYADYHFIVSDIESEMPTSEYDKIVDDLYCEDFAL